MECTHSNATAAHRLCYPTHVGDTPCTTSALYTIHTASTMASTDAQEATLLAPVYVPLRCLEAMAPRAHAMGMAAT